MATIEELAKLALEYNYMDWDANRELAIAVHDAFANGTLHEGLTNIQKAVNACSQNGEDK